MKKSFFLLTLTAAVFTLSGCRTVRIEGPEIKVPAAKPRLQQAKQSLKDKKNAATAIPPVLGGLVSSDSWVIYKDKQQEEFKGNVSYDNGIYSFRADYALSERAYNRFSAKGNVHVKQAEPGAPVYEAFADTARYNYQTKKGTLSAAKNKTLRLIYKEGKQLPVTAYAKKASFDLQEGLFVLEGNVRVERPAPEGKQILRAQKATYRQFQNHLTVEGGAEVSDPLRTLQADTIVYDGNKNYSYAYGSRPLLSGQSEQGTFAIIADKVQADNEGDTVLLDGKVQGWLVSPQINDAAVNEKF